MSLQNLVNYNVSKGWGTEPKELYETLTECAKIIQKEVVDECRHWQVVRIICDLDGNYYEYETANTTGDISPLEAGWEPDYSTMREVHPITETITITKYI